MNRDVKIKQKVEKVHAANNEMKGKNNYQTFWKKVAKITPSKYTLENINELIKESDPPLLL